MRLRIIIVHFFNNSLTLSEPFSRALSSDNGRSAKV